MTDCALRMLSSQSCAVSTKSEHWSNLENDCSMHDQRCLFFLFAQFNVFSNVCLFPRKQGTGVQHVPFPKNSGNLWICSMFSLLIFFWDETCSQGIEHLRKHLVGSKNSFPSLAQKHFNGSETSSALVTTNVVLLLTCSNLNCYLFVLVNRGIGYLGTMVDGFDCCCGREIPHR